MESSGCRNQQPIHNSYYSLLWLVREIQIIEHHGKEQDEASEDSYESMDYEWQGLILSFCLFVRFTYWWAGPKLYNFTPSDY